MAITRVNTAEAASDAGSGALALSAMNASSGNLIVVFVRDANMTPTSVTDTAGNTYTSLASVTTANPRMSVWVATNITGNATNVISINFPAGTRDFCWGYAIQYSGCATSSPTDVSGARSDTAATDLVTSSFSTAQASEVVVVAASQPAFVTYSAGADFTLVDGTIGTGSGNFGGVEEYITSGTLSGYAAHITSSDNNSYTIVWAAFKAAAGGGGSSTGAAAYTIAQQ